MAFAVERADAQAQGVLAFFLPRYNLVPGGPVRTLGASFATCKLASEPRPTQSAEAAGAWLAKQLSLSPATVTAATAQLDNALEGALWVLPLMEWWYATSLHSVLGDSLPQRKKRA